MTDTQAPVRRVDRDRRDRIIDACLTVIARDGVAGTSHRRVAAEAGVPLGAMTYYFTGMDELLTEAFTRFADASAADTAARIAAATSTSDLELILAAVIDHGAALDAREHAITYELYALAARQPAYRAITHHWLDSNRRVLEQHVDPTTARILDALVEGLTLHQALDPTTDSRLLGLDAIRRITSHQPGKDQP